MVDQYVWLFTGAGQRTHAVRRPGRERSMAQCGTSPHWGDPVGWRGWRGDDKARADQLDRCGRCTRTIAGGAR